MRRWQEVTLGAFVLMGLVSTVGLIRVYRTRDQPVAFMLGSGDIHDHHGFEILNPFRNRAPEQPAEMFLMDFKKNCLQALKTIDANAKYTSYICEIESVHPLITWRLDAREDMSPSHVHLRFTMKRYATPQMKREFDNPFWIEMERGVAGWKIKTYETYY